MATGRMQRGGSGGGLLLEVPIPPGLRRLG